MFRLPVPDISLHDVFDLSPRRLHALGVKLLLLDLDNTLAAYGEAVPSRVLRRWLKNLRGAGIEPVIFSNSRGNRPARFAAMLAIEAVDHAHKPNPKKLLALLDERGLRPCDAALCGDQVYTDVFCAKRAGALAICVRPLSFWVPTRALRYAAEAPFRLAGKVRGPHPGAGG